jgi:tripartite-type tricarboxylate transporter receptor subunit TctC
MFCVVGRPLDGRTIRSLHAVREMKMKTFKRCSPLILAMAALLPVHAGAQSLASLVPKKPVLIVVPNAAAGPNDYLARVIAPKLGEVLHQTVVVDNKASANGVTAGEFVAHAAADGSTLAVGNTGTHAVNATLYRKLSYDVVRDCVPVINVFETQLVLAAYPKFPADSIRDIIAIARKSPGSINVAIAGATGEIATNAIKIMAGVDLNNVPYKGGAPAVIAVISGESHFVLTPYSGVGAQADAGKLKILGVTGARRDPMLGNIPTLAESGLPGYDITMWYGIFAPPKTPAAIVNAYNREIAQLVNQPETRSKLTSQGFEIVTGTPEQFAEVVRRDVERFRKIILDAKMQQDL